MYHLLAKVGVEGLKSHPFINEFIPSVDEDDGICYTHPQNLPGEQNIVLLVVGIVLVLDLSLSASPQVLNKMEVWLTFFTGSLRLTTLGLESVERYLAMILAMFVGIRQARLNQ